MSTEVTMLELGREKIELIKLTVAKGATDLELDLFLHACKRTGLDPLMKQIYAIKRWNNQERRETMSIQTGIDGYRLIADRTGLYAGSNEPVYTGEEDVYPLKAMVTVYKLVGGAPRAFSASARWEEHCQFTKDGAPTAMWKKMPYLMLAKCAEALALRKAFPAELSGVYTHEEMMQADVEDRKPLKLPSEILRESERPAPETRGEDGLVMPVERAHVAIRTSDPASQDAPLSTGLRDAYLEQIAISETVSECSQAINAGLADPSLSVFDKTMIQDAGKSRIVALRKK